ncbi:hypothetical protein F5X99DRAFT_283471 [Biscogniauxia marginata]|nr:hypothetical protein F5X99DRAFT_283471 [Biscogniauxia marginata]
MTPLDGVSQVGVGEVLLVVTASLGPPAVFGVYMCNRSHLVAAEASLSKLRWLRLHSNSALGLDCGHLIDSSVANKLCVMLCRRCRSMCHWSFACDGWMMDGSAMKAGLSASGHRPSVAIIRAGNEEPKKTGK